MERVQLCGRFRDEKCLFAPFDYMRCQIAPEEVQTDADVVERIRHYIDTNYEKDLSLTTLSKHFFISKYQISRLFKKQFGINYSDYILKARMEAAAVILLNFRGNWTRRRAGQGLRKPAISARCSAKYYGVSSGGIPEEAKGEEGWRGYFIATE